MADYNNRHPNIRTIRGGADDGEGFRDEETTRAAKARRMRILRRVVPAAAAVVVVAVLSIFLFRRFMAYETYSVVWQKDMNQGSLVGYEPFGSGFLKYSKDGVTCLSARGAELWVDTYEMKNPKISVNGDYAVIADCQGSDLRIYNPEGRIGEASTLLPLTRAAVSGTGVTAVIEEDASSSYIMFFREDGSSLDITVKSIISGDGYPTDLALSPDGTRLMVSYEYLSGGSLMGRVVFYDFSEIGKNIPNRLVGGFDEPFTDSLMAEVHYFDSTYSFAASNTGLCFFSSRNLASPELVKEVRMTDEIRSLFYSGSYVGVVVDASDSQMKYRLEVYKPDGTQVMSKEFDESFLHASVDDEYVYLFNSNSGMIYNLAGTRKFLGELNFPVVRMRKGTVPGEFLFAGPNNLKAVRLR